MAALVGFDVAIAELLTIGIDTVASGVASASGRIRDILGNFPSLALTGTNQDRGIVSFVHERLDPDAVVARLADGGVTGWVNPAAGAPLDGNARGHLPSVRLSPHHNTTDEEFDRLGVTLRTFG